jgi:hypothetical protein
MGADGKVEEVRQIGDFLRLEQPARFGNVDVNRVATLGQNEGLKTLALVKILSGFTTVMP